MTTQQPASSIQSLINRHWPLVRGRAIRCEQPTNRAGDLFPEEAAQFSGKSLKRQAEYSTGRALAHELMEELGYRPAAVLRDDRAPVWPDSLCGSISHTNQVVACAVAEKRDYLSIGIDVEEIGRIDRRLATKLYTESERRRLGDDAHQLAAAFSAKEAGYKATHPIGGKYIGFHEAEVILKPSEGRFDLNYLGTHEPNRVMNQAQGYLLSDERYVLTLVIIPQPQAD